MRQENLRVTSGTCTGMNRNFTSKFLSIHQPEIFKKNLPRKKTATLKMQETQLFLGNWQKIQRLYSFLLVFVRFRSFLFIWNHFNRPAALILTCFCYSLPLLSRFYSLYGISSRFYSFPTHFYSFLLQLYFISTSTLLQLYFTSPLLQLYFILT